MRTLRDSLIETIERFALLAGREPSAVATRIFNDGKRWGVLSRGGDLNTRTYEAAMQWLSDNWPDGAEWPAGVARPLPAVSPGEPPSAPDGASQGGRGAPAPDTRPEAAE